MKILFFGPGVITLNVSVPIVDDELVEVDEMFYGKLCLLGDSTLQARVELAPDRANATITDNDSMLIIIQIALL